MTQHAIVQLNSLWWVVVDKTGTIIGKHNSRGGAEHDRQWKAPRQSFPVEEFIVKPEQRE